jgi:hypothetical protein
MRGYPIFAPFYLLASFGTAVTLIYEITKQNQKYPWPESVSELSCHFN